ncbi:hypothetical protein KXV23_004117 [Aspergillus fumigatus]|nr:hypothetical protein KXV23_004117 [Aspergillus fumigatus]
MSQMPENLSHSRLDTSAGSTIGFDLHPLPDGLEPPTSIEPAVTGILLYLDKYLEVLEHNGSISFNRSDSPFSVHLCEQLGRLFSIPKPHVVEGPLISWARVVLSAGSSPGHLDQNTPLKVGESTIQLSEEDHKLLASGRPWQFLNPWAYLQDYQRELALVNEDIDGFRRMKGMLRKAAGLADEVEQQLSYRRNLLSNRHHEKPHPSAFESSNHSCDFSAEHTMRIHMCIDDAMHQGFNAESATGHSPHNKPYEPRDSTPIAGKGYVDVTLQAISSSVPQPFVYQSKDEPSSTIGRYSASAATALNPEFSAERQHETRLRLLQSCRFEGGRPLDAEIAETFRHVLEAERFLMTRDARETLMVLLSPDQWEANLSCGLHGLGLPREWRGIKGAVNYLRVLDAKKIAEYSIQERFALLLLSLNYEDLREHPERYCPEDPTVSGVLNSILREYPDDPRVSQRPKQRRNKISASYAKVGRWLWTLAATLGFGILLLADGQLVRIMYKETFVPRHFNALATLASYTRPGTIRIFQSLEPMVKCILFGRVTDDLRSDISRLLAPEALAIAAHEDSQGLRRQETANSWIVVEDAESSRKERMAELLAQLPPAR